MAVARAIVQLRCQRRRYELVMDDGTVFFARTIVIATGACYNKPTAVALDRFAGRGIHYGATYIESQMCEGEEVVVVGGGNSSWSSCCLPLPVSAQGVHGCASARLGRIDVAISHSTHHFADCHSPKISGQIRESPA
jgi:thioredoxin reductase (NADPH)